MVIQIKHVLGLSEEVIFDKDRLFTELNIDSLMLIEFENKLQDYLGDLYVFNTNELFDYPSVRKLSDYIEREIARKKSE